MPNDTLYSQTTPLAAPRAKEVAPRIQRPERRVDSPPEEAWCPAVNVLRFVDRIEVIVELAGLDREDVLLSIGYRYLRIHGVRSSLETDCGNSDEAGCRELMMEINKGPFDRILSLPQGLTDDPDQVKVHQESGLLWITIPVSD